MYYFNNNKKKQQIRAMFRFHSYFYGFYHVYIDINILRIISRIYHMDLYIRWIYIHRSECIATLLSTIRYRIDIEEI